MWWSSMAQMFLTINEEYIKFSEKKNTCSRSTINALEERPLTFDQVFDH